LQHCWCWQKYHARLAFKQTSGRIAHYDKPGSMTIRDFGTTLMTAITCSFFSKGKGLLKNESQMHKFVYDLQTDMTDDLRNENFLMGRR